VRHPEAGTILVDTGFHRDAKTSLRGDFGTTMGLVFRSLRPADEPYEEQLARCGVDPAAVERVVMTHLHVDHTSGMRLLPNARFLCDAVEWRAANATGASVRGYVGKHLPPESRVDLVDFEADGQPHGPFARTIDLLGDGSVRLISTPGHTPGHLSVLLRARGDAPVLLVGDAVYTLRSMREEILPLLTAGDEAYRRSLRELKAFAEDEPEAILVPSHDPSAWRELHSPPRPARVRRRRAVEELR
jgi:glyoxylase-like metal-dependent hydrolase (beta-lactamase superfamily II)